MRPAEEERGWVKKYGAHIVRPASSRQQGSRGGPGRRPRPRGAGAALDARPGLAD